MGWSEREKLSRREWVSDRRFETVEGERASGMMRYPSSSNWVIWAGVRPWWVEGVLGGGGDMAEGAMILDSVVVSRCVDD